MAAYVRGLSQIAESDFQTGMTQTDVTVAGPQRQLWAARNKGWVNAAELEEANALLERLCELLSQPRDASRDRPMSLAFVLTPSLVRGRRRAARNAKTR